MIGLKKHVYGSFLFFYLLSGLTGCRDMLHDMNEISADLPEINSLEMVEIRDVTNGGTSGLSPYRICKFETTYLLWYEIFTWAEHNGFKFVKQAEDGNTGYTGVPSIHAYLPVTNVHPADIFTWCNALSVKKGLTPVYYKDAACKEVLKSSFDVASENYVIDDNLYHNMTGDKQTVYDYKITKNIYQKTSANGYRLPTVTEWQYAAMGAKRTSEDRNFDFAGSNNLTEVASTHMMKIPGSFKPNGIGCYDMSGNVSEYSIVPGLSGDGTCITITDSQLHTYGGHWFDGNKDTYSVKRLYDLKGIIHLYVNLFGFRLVQSIVE